MCFFEREHPHTYDLTRTNTHKICCRTPLKQWSLVARTSYPKRACAREAAVAFCADAERPANARVADCGVGM